MTKMLIARSTLLMLSIFCAQTYAEADQGVSKVVITLNHYLIRASNKQASPQAIPQAALTIAQSNPLTTQSRPTSYTFPNHPLSPGCGRHISRCRELPILFEEQDSLVGILTPLNNAIGFMCFEDARKELVHQTTHIMTFPHHDDCIPITIVRHKTKHYVVCIDSSMRVISCSINLNFDNITQSYLQCASLGSFLPSVDFSEISNFVYVSGDLFIFAVQNIVYEYYPDRLSLASVSGCTLPHLAHNVRLVYNDIDTVLMYYNTNEGADIVVVFNLANECWDRFFTDVELEYSCFNGFNVFVYPSDSAILYEMHEPTENPLQIYITGTNFTTGLCFGNTFIYVDRLKGTFLLNIASGNNTLISDSMCLREYCWTPVLYQEMYLVLQEGGYLVVRNIEDNYKPVINVSNGNTYLIGFLIGTPYEKEIDVHVGNGSGFENIYLGIAGGVFALVILAAGITLAMWKVAKTISGTYRRTHTPPEEAHPMHSSVGAIISTDTNLSLQANKNATPPANHTPPQTTSTSTPPGDSQLLQYSCPECGLAPNDPPHSHTPTTDQSDVESTNRQGILAAADVEITNMQGTPAGPGVSASDRHAGPDIESTNMQGTPAGPGVRASDRHAGPDIEATNIQGTPAGPGVSASGPDIEATNMQGTPTGPGVRASYRHAGSDVESTNMQGTPAGPGVSASYTHAGPDIEANSVHSRAPGQTLYTNYGVGVEVQAKKMEGTNEVGVDVAGTHFSPHETTNYHPSSVAEKNNAKSRGEDNHNHSTDTMRHLD